MKKVEFQAIKIEKNENGLIMDPPAMNPPAMNPAAISNQPSAPPLPTSSETPTQSSSNLSTNTVTIQSFPITQTSTGMVFPSNNQKCDWNGPLKSIEEHEKICKYKDRICYFCKKSIQFYNLEVRFLN